MLRSTLYYKSAQSAGSPIQYSRGPMQRETPPRTAPLPPSDRSTRANLGRALYSMTWPMMFGVLALMSYQLVDSVYISMLGTEPLAALGFTVAVNQLAIGIQVGLGIATTAL